MQLRNTLALCIILFLSIGTHCAANYKLVKLTDPDALCLDGTPGAYYIY